MDYSAPLNADIDLAADLAASLGNALLQKKWLLATAESCTGGLLSAQITAVAGSSAWFTCGFITYSNASKMQLLGVSSETLLTYGAVSEQTALEMATGALQKSNAHISVSITGIAGPSGGTAEKPIGMVCFAWATVDYHLSAATHHFKGHRQQVRAEAVQFAMAGLMKLLST